ncbi:MAG: diguanylate cyclase domain-containing protein [Micromonosporaceae bacterium]
MSSIHDLITTAALGGILAGYALSAALLWQTRRALRAARRDATHDETTGLPNRRALYARLGKAARCCRFAVAVLDLDRLKIVNDTHGHQAGDEVLRAVAARLAALPAPALLAARLSGDEFVLLIDDRYGDALVAAHAAWRAVGGAEIPLPGGVRVHVTASVGVAVARVGVDPRRLLHQADLAMYTAKRDDRGVRLFTPDMDTGTSGMAARPAIRPRDRRRRRAPGPATTARRRGDGSDGLGGRPR